MKRRKSGTVSIQFLGAAGTVTGSKHLLKTPAGNVLIDCGLFQGLKSLRLKNWQPLPIAVTEIHSVLLTHAHLDHCGYLPILWRMGFRGKIYCTAPTRELTEIILRDSAKIQMEDARHANRIGFTKHRPAEPLYTEKHVEKVLPLLVTVSEGERINIFEKVHATFWKNGHILGSSYIDVDCFGKRIVFSGDLGRPVSGLLLPPHNCVHADFLIMESTYGDRIHPTAQASEELAKIILETIKVKGNLLIPSFAVGRAQELIALISELKKSNRIPNIPTYMDSPMGADATQVFLRHPTWHKLSPEQCTAFRNDVTVIRKFEETLRVIQEKGSKIVIAASGMLTGGRALFYLQNYVGGVENTILFTGYQAEGTRGRALLNGAHEVRMHGKYFKVAAKIRSLPAMSAHADQQEMVDWMSKLKQAPTKVFLVHGENSARDAFRVKIQSELKWEVETPELLEEFKLFQVSNK